MPGTQSRKDLYQAHRLMTQRASLALLRGEPDVPDQPLRRLNVATFSSALVALIVAAIFALLAVLGHGSSPLKLAPGILLVDGQTGTPYVVCQKHKLCPVLNYASARLALGGAPVSQQTVSQQSLAKYPRGPLIGIPGLPPDLPGPGLLFKGPWSVCARTALAGSAEPLTTALAGDTDPGGQPLGNGAIAVQAGGKDWVIWDGQRFAIQPGTLAALTSPKPPVAVSTTWLDALAQGPDLAPPAISNFGAHIRGPGGGPAHIGQVYQVSLTPAQQRYYVLLANGSLAPITQTQAVLLESELRAPSQGTLSLSQVRAHQSATTFPANGLPRHMPKISGVGVFTTLCDIYGTQGNGASPTGQVTMGGRMPKGGTPVSGPPVSGISGPPGTSPAGVSRISLPAGKGALVGLVPGTIQPGQPPARPGAAVSYFLITDGRRYGLASKRVAGMLGYSLASQAVLLPARVVDLIPAGPALDPAAAARPAGPGG